MHSLVSLQVRSLSSIDNASLLSIAPGTSSPSSAGNASLISFAPGTSIPDANGLGVNAPASILGENLSVLNPVTPNPGALPVHQVPTPDGTSAPTATPPAAVAENGNIVCRSGSPIVPMTKVLDGPCKKGSPCNKENHTPVTSQEGTDNQHGDTTQGRKRQGGGKGTASKSKAAK